MNITNQLFEVNMLFANNGFITILKQMTFVVITIFPKCSFVEDPDLSGRFFLLLIGLKPPPLVVVT